MPCFPPAFRPLHQIPWMEMSANYSWSADKSTVKHLTDIYILINMNVIGKKSKRKETSNKLPQFALYFFWPISVIVSTSEPGTKLKWFLFTVWTGLWPNCPVHFPQVDVMTLSWLSWRRKPSPQRERQDWLLGKPGTQLVAWSAWSQHKWQIIDWVMDDEIRFTSLNKVRHFSATC